MTTGWGDNDRVLLECVPIKMVEYAFGRLSQQGRKTVDYHPAVIRYLEVSVIHDFTCLFHAPIESLAIAYDPQRYLLPFLQIIALG